jgi:hypothetical protein
MMINLTEYEMQISPGKELARRMILMSKPRKYIVTLKTCITRNFSTNTKLARIEPMKLII